MENCLTCTDYNVCAACIIVNFTLTVASDGCTCNEASQYFANNDRCIQCS